MVATGIVRRVDEFGRIVIPRELRRQINIKEGTPLEIFRDGENIILSKYFFTDNDKESEKGV